MHGATVHCKPARTCLRHLASATEVHIACRTAAHLCRNPCSKRRKLRAAAGPVNQQHGERLAMCLQSAAQHPRKRAHPACFQGIFRRNARACRMILRHRRVRRRISGEKQPGQFWLDRPGIMPGCVAWISAISAPCDCSRSRSPVGSLLSSAAEKEMVVSRTATQTSSAINPNELNALVQTDSTLAPLSIIGQTDICD